MKIKNMNPQCKLVMLTTVGSMSSLPGTSAHVKLEPIPPNEFRRVETGDLYPRLFFVIDKRGIGRPAFDGIDFTVED